jgi:hypothetical protein
MRVCRIRKKKFLSARERKINEFMYLVRGFLVWLVIVFVESVHGTLRQLFLSPLIGDFTARRIGFFIGMLVIFLVAYSFVRWISAENAKQLFFVGLMWAILMLAFEFGLGIFVLNYSSERMLEDYDVSRGGLMGFGIVFMTFAPLIAGKISGLYLRSANS